MGCFDDASQLLGLAKTTAQVGRKRGDVTHSASFKAALREIIAGSISGDKSAPHMRDQLLAQDKHLSSLIDDAHTSSAIERLVVGGKSFDSVMDALNKDASLAPQFRVIAEAIAHIAGDVPVRSVADLGELRTDVREIHIVSDADKGSASVLLNRPARHSVDVIAAREA